MKLDKKTMIEVRNIFLDMENYIDYQKGYLNYLEKKVCKLKEKVRGLE